MITVKTRLARRKNEPRWIVTRSMRRDNYTTSSAWISYKLTGLPYTMKERHRSPISTTLSWIYGMRRWTNTAHSSRSNCATWIAHGSLWTTIFSIYQVSQKMYHSYILNILKTMHVMCMILASCKNVFHGNFCALTNTFPVMKQLGIKQGKVIVQYYFKFGSNILT